MGTADRNSKGATLRPIVREESGFEFATALRTEREGRAVAHAELRFRVCEEQILVCEVVDARLELPVEVRFAR